MQNVNVRCSRAIYGSRIRRRRLAIRHTADRNCGRHYPRERFCRALRRPVSGAELGRRSPIPAHLARAGSRRSLPIMCGPRRPVQRLCLERARQVVELPDHAPGRRQKSHEGSIPAPTACSSRTTGRTSASRPTVVSASMRTATRNMRCSLTSPAATLPRAGSATSSANVISRSPDRERLEWTIHTRWKVKYEPESRDVQTPLEAAAMSIAISLKRIADHLNERVGQKANLPRAFARRTGPR